MGVLPTGRPSNTSSLDSLVPSYDTNVHRSKRSQRPYVKMAPLKNRDRALAKAMNDYSNCTSPIEAHLLDIARCTVCFDDPLTLVFFYGVLCALAEVVRVKNRFGKPTQRDMMLNLRMPNGHIVEVQLGIDKLFLIRSWDHPMYQIARTQSDEELIEVVKLQAECVRRPVLESDYEDMVHVEKDLAQR